MGTTLANLHILDGDESQLQALLPNAIIGRWSARFVSAYMEFAPKFNEKTARSLSKKMAQPILFAWLFDSDAIGLIIYQGGKLVAGHVMSPDGYSKMGNIALFCEALELSPDDVSRLRAVWKKGDAEEQLDLTARLLGLPLYHDHDMLPDKVYTRDTQTVDRWIAERPVPPRVKNETTVLLLQEIPRFRWNYTPGSTQYCSAEPYDDEYTFDSCQFWKTDASGILISDWSTEQYLLYQTDGDRVLGFDKPGGTVIFDSAGFLPEDYQSKSKALFFMPDGGLLWCGGQPLIGEPITFILCARDGSELWRISRPYPRHGFFASANSEIIFASDTLETCALERVDALTGEVIEKLPRPFGLNVWSKEYNDGFWWITHDGRMLKDGERTERGNTLSKLDGALRVVAEIPLPTYTQGLFFSPDNKYVYVFFYKNQVMVVDTENLAIVNVLNDKSCLHPRGFDAAGRFWLQRDNSTVEAWDAVLDKALSRHKLKGAIMGHHKTMQGAMCVATWSDKEKTLRVCELR